MHSEDKTVKKFYVPSKRTSRYLKQKWIKQQEKIDKFIAEVKDFNIILSAIGTHEEKVSKNIKELTANGNYHDLCVTLHAATAYFFFKCIREMDQRETTYWIINIGHNKFKSI